MMNCTRAVILAAGMGTRLVPRDSIPKPMVEVGGVPLVVRVLRGLEAAGVREVALVVGYRREILREALARLSTGLRITYFDNDAFDKPNGTSLLAAASFVEGPTFVLMSDHLWAPAMIERVGAFPLEAGQSVLGIDRRIDRCFDLDDATKVLTAGDRIDQIGKMLPEYDAIDTGVFRITRGLIDALVSVDGREGCSLSQGVEVLARRGDMRVVDVGAAAWIDVDTKEAQRIADGLVARFGDALEVPAELSADAIRTLGCVL